jgi:hypothetical protein
VKIFFFGFVFVLLLELYWITFNTQLFDSVGVGFWESLEGMLVRIPAPVAVSASDRFNQFYVVGNSGNFTTRMNARGGVTLALDADNKADTHPDRIQIYNPYGATNPLVSMGDTLEDIVGTLDWQYNKW